MRKMKLPPFFLCCLLLSGCTDLKDYFLCESADGQVIRLAWTESKPVAIHINDLPPFSQSMPWVREIQLSENEMVLLYRHKIFYGYEKTHRSYEADLIVDYHFDRARQILSVQEYYENLPDELAPKGERDIKYSCQKSNALTAFFDKMGNLISEMAEKII